MISTTDARYNAAAHTVWISMFIIGMMDRLEEAKLYRTCDVVSQSSVKPSCDKSQCVWGNQWCCCQHVHPLANTHRFVRLRLMDAAQGVQSVRPTHRGYHQEGEVCTGGQWHLQCGYVPEDTMLVIGLEKQVEIERSWSRVRQGWN